MPFSAWARPLASSAWSLSAARALAVSFNPSFCAACSKGTLLRRHANRIKCDVCRGVERPVDLLDRPAFGLEAEQQKHQRGLTVPEGEE